MTDLISVLKPDPTEWLLEEDNPSVRYFTLTDIQGKLENDSEAKKAKDDIMKVGLVPKILTKQNNEGYWEIPKSFYTAKYRGTVWQLVILAELGADGKDERVKKACEFILENSQDNESGGGFHPYFFHQLEVHQNKLATLTCVKYSSKIRVFQSLLLYGCCIPFHTHHLNCCSCFAPLSVSAQGSS